jgi:hypothetical protein
MIYINFTYLNAIHDRDPNTADANAPTRYNITDTFKTWNIQKDGGISIIDHQSISEDAMIGKSLFVGM